MLVGQLIEELKKYDENSEILIYKGNGNIDVIKRDNIEYDELTNEVILT